VGFILGGSLVPSIYSGLKMSFEEPQFLTKTRKSIYISPPLKEEAFSRKTKIMVFGLVNKRELF